MDGKFLVKANNELYSLEGKKSDREVMDGGRVKETLFSTTRFKTFAFRRKASAGSLGK
jgi:hypothetical protein